MYFPGLKRSKLTAESSRSIVFPPCQDSGFERAVGETGKDDVLFIFGVKSFVRDNVLGIKAFSRVPVEEAPSARMAAFSISEVEFRYLELSFGSKFLMDDLPLDEGPGDTLILA